MVVHVQCGGALHWLACLANHMCFCHKLPYTLATTTLMPLKPLGKSTLKAKKNEQIDRKKF